MKFYGGVRGSKMNKWLNFGGDLSLLRWVIEQKYIVVAACRDRGAGNDPEALGLAFHQGPTFINATVKLLQAETEDYESKRLPIHVSYWSNWHDIPSDPSYSRQYGGNDLLRPRKCASFSSLLLVRCWNCPTHLNSSAWATWAVCAEIKNYSLIKPDVYNSYLLLCSRLFIIFKVAHRKSTNTLNVDLYFQNCPDNDVLILIYVFMLQPFEVIVVYSDNANCT